jgi:hypothetical protein
MQLLLHFTYVLKARFLMIREDFTILHPLQEADRVTATKDMKNDVHSTCGRDKKRMHSLGRNK